jgi:AraC-like DNA-binding protein
MKFLATPAGPTVSVRLLLPIRRALEAAGHDWVAFFQKHAIAPALFDDSSGRIDHDVALRIYEDLKALAGDTFHLDAAEQVLQNDTDAFGYAARAARTGGESMERFVRYARLLHDTITNQIRVEGELAHWELIIPPDLRFSNEAGEFLIGMFLVLCRRHTGVDLRPRVRLQRARPADPSAFHRVLSGEIVWEAPLFATEFPKAWLDIRLPEIDPRLASTLPEFADNLLARLPAPGQFTKKVREHIADELPAGAVSLVRVAERMKVSPRTVRRRLEEEKTNFSLELDGVRSELAKSYVERSTRSITEVAFLLGFSSVSAFHKAFRRWHGAAPTDLRQKA